VNPVRSFAVARPLPQGQRRRPADAATPAAPLHARRAAVFLDKDGTLIENVPYNVDPALLRFTPRALPALQLLSRAGFALVVVTNQSGIGLGRFTRAQFLELQRALVDRLHDEAGVELLDLYLCPHPPSAAGLPACLCRKPADGLLRQAALGHRLDLARSWMVGDILDDIEAGRRAGCRTVLLDVGHETEWRLNRLRLPHHRCGDLFDAAQIIVESRDRLWAAPRAGAGALPRYGGVRRTVRRAAARPDAAAALYR